MKKSVSLLVAAMMLLTVVAAAGVATAAVDHSREKKDSTPTGAVPVWLEAKDEKHTVVAAWAFVEPIKNLPGNFKVTKVLLTDAAKDLNLKDDQKFNLWVEFKVWDKDKKEVKWSQDVLLATLKKEGDKLVFVNPKTLTVQQGVALAVLTKQALLEVTLV